MGPTTSTCPSRWGTRWSPGTTRRRRVKAPVLSGVDGAGASMRPGSGGLAVRPGDGPEAVLTQAGIQAPGGAVIQGVVVFDEGVDDAVPVVVALVRAEDAAHVVLDLLRGDHRVAPSLRSALVGTRLGQELASVTTKSSM